MCGHCSGRVKKALEAIAGVETAEVSHETGMAAVTLNGHVSDEELAKRKAAWVCPEPRVKTGYLARYAKMVTSADKGAILDF